MYTVILYIYCFLLTCFFSTKNSSLDAKRLYVFLLFSTLIIFRAYIDPFSLPDLPTYYNSYHDVERISVFSYQDVSLYETMHKEEYGFILLLKMCSLFSSDFQFFLIVYSSILLFLYLYVILKLSPNVYLSVLLMLLLVFVQSLFVLRQHMAVAIALLTYISVIERKLPFYLILCVIAFLFHKSSLIWFPVYFLYGFSNRTLLISLALSPLLFVFVFSNLTLFNDSLKLGYGSYIYGEKVTSSNLTTFLISLSFFCLYLYSLKSKAYAIGVNRIVFISMIFDLIFTLVGTNVGLLNRFSLFFHTSIIFLLPLSFGKMSVSKSMLLSIIPIAFLVFINFFGSSSKYQSNLSLKGGEVYNIPVIILAIAALFYMVKKNCARV